MSFHQDISHHRGRSWPSDPAFSGIVGLKANSVEEENPASWRGDSERFAGRLAEEGDSPALSKEKIGEPDLEHHFKFIDTMLKSDS